MDVEYKLIKRKTMKLSNSESPLIGISACLLGQKVRYDGEHKLDEWMAVSLKKFVEYYPLCPEVEMGLGIPRPPVQLQKIDNEIRMVSKSNGEGHTVNARSTIDRLIQNMPSLSGFILMKKSPSCGYERVKLYNKKSELIAGIHGQGLFAAELRRVFPFLPIIDSGRIQDSLHRENFLRMIFIYHRFQQMPFKLSSFQDFHQKHKFIFMEYHQNTMRELGHLVATTTKENFEARSLEYLEMMMGMLEDLPSKKNRVNSLMHLLGFFKNDLDSKDKTSFLKVLEDYKTGNVPYLVPLKLLEFLAIKYKKDYILDQYLLKPFPDGIMVSN